MTPRLSAGITWAVIPLLVGLDQWSKTMIVNRFYLGESVPIAGNALLFTRVHNPGAAFGILQAYPEAFTVLTSVAIVLITIHKYLTPPTSLLYQSALGIILSGAAGNLIDRLKYNYVVDFIDVGVGSNRWPAFNVADSCISIGVTLLIATSFFEKPSGAADDTGGAGGTGRAESPGGADVDIRE